MSVNQVTLMGYIGKDPEIKMTQGGQQVASFSVATTESWVKDGKKEEKTEWHRCVAWGKTAENIAKFFKKGSGIFVQGKIQTRTWDGQDGQKHYATEIIVSSFQFPAKPPATNNSGNNSAAHSDNDAPRGGAPAGGGNFGSDEDVPF
jgi:single-strand DNA-binding protein